MKLRTVNKVEILGNIVGEILYKASFQGTWMRVLVSDKSSWTDPTSHKRLEMIQFHTVIFRNKLAEVYHPILKKGHQLHVRGEVRSFRLKGKQRWRQDNLIEVNEVLNHCFHQTQYAANKVTFVCNLVKFKDVY